MQLKTFAIQHYSIISFCVSLLLFVFENSILTSILHRVLIRIRLSLQCLLISVKWFVQSQYYACSDLKLFFPLPMFLLWNFAKIFLNKFWKMFSFLFAYKSCNKSLSPVRKKETKDLWRFETEGFSGGVGFLPSEKFHSGFLLWS